MRTSMSKVDIEVLRDRNGEFEPKILPKNQKSISQDMENKIISMYAKGMSTSDIEDNIWYTFNRLAHMISTYNT